MPLRPRLRALSCPPAQRTGLAGDCQKLTALPFPQSLSLNSWDSIPDVLGCSPLTCSFWQQQAPTLFISPCSSGQAHNSFLLPASLSPLETPICTGSEQVIPTHSPRTKYQWQTMVLTTHELPSPQGPALPTKPPSTERSSLPSALAGVPDPQRCRIIAPLGTYKKKQWAAVRTHWASISVPPQMWVWAYCRLTCQGHLLSGASAPPTIRPVRAFSPQPGEK